MTRRGLASGLGTTRDLPRRRPSFCRMEAVEGPSAGLKLCAAAAFLDFRSSFLYRLTANL